MTVENVYFRNAGNSGQLDTSIYGERKNLATNPISQNGTLLVPQEAAMAMRAYSLSSAPAVPQQIGNPDLNTLKQTLLKRGFVEGKDFEIKVLQDGSRLNIYKYGKPVKEYFWNSKTGTPDSFDEVSTTYYSANSDVEKIETHIGANNKFICRRRTYEKNPFRHNAITINTNSKEYMEYLDKNNIKYTYTVEPYYDKGYKFVNISTYDPITKNMSTVDISENLDGSVNGIKQELYDENNKVYRTIEYDKDYTEVIDWDEKPEYKFQTFSPKL